MEFLGTRGGKGRGVKLPAYKAGLPGKETGFIWIVPLGPAYKAGLAGHSPVKRSG